MNFKRKWKLLYEHEKLNIAFIIDESSIYPQNKQDYLPRDTTVVVTTRCHTTWCVPWANARLVTFFEDEVVFHLWSSRGAQ